MAVYNISVILVPVIFPVILVILSWVVYKIWDYHSLARRLILDGAIYLVRFLLAVFWYVFISFLLIV